MCVICVSKQGVRQPTLKEMENMFNHNPDGAGIMFYNRNAKKVEIAKGFMDFQTFSNFIKACRFTKDDLVVYHFRIGTQGSNSPELTHPYPLTKDINTMKHLDLTCDVGIAHNGIIRLTSDGNPDYNDTMLFISKYLSRFIRNRNDFNDKELHSLIKEMANSKFAMVNNTGDVVTIGDFINDKGLLFSNNSYLSYDNRWNHNFTSNLVKSWNK